MTVPPARWWARRPDCPRSACRPALRSGRRGLSGPRRAGWRLRRRRRETVTTQLPDSWRTSTVTCRALLCLAVLARHSQITKYAAVSAVAVGRRGKATVSATGIGLRAATASSAAASPRSRSTGGPMPRTRSRSSPTACTTSSRAWSTSRCAIWGSFSNVSLASPRSADSATSRAWAPSCRSASMRCSSRCCPSTAAARVAARAMMRACKRAVRLGARKAAARRACPAARPRVAQPAAHSSTKPPSAHGSAAGTLPTTT